MSMAWNCHASAFFKIYEKDEASRADYQLSADRPPGRGQAPGRDTLTNPSPSSTPQAPFGRS